jgi:ParB family chromosome partitioning protein
MAARKRATRKKSPAKSRLKSARGSARKRLAPARQRRGPPAAETPLRLDDPALHEACARVSSLGGAAVGAYRDPLSGRAVLVAIVPVSSVEPTPFQRDLSPTHTKRLAEKIDEAGVFLDPLIAVLAPGGALWTPNGRHRLAAAKVLGLQSITVLIAADPGLAYRILALNTEKAHNLKDRSLEVVRMARALAAQRRPDREVDHASEFESPALLTLGATYERDKRFAGSAYHPMLRRVDRFSSKPLGRSLAERDAIAARILEIDARVREIIGELQERGFRSPYLRSLVVARINPVRFAGRTDGAPAMTLTAALTRMAAGARRFDPASVRERDLALVSAIAPPESEREARGHVPMKRGSSFAPQGARRGRFA